MNIQKIQVQKSIFLKNCSFSGNRSVFFLKPQMDTDEHKKIFTDGKRCMRSQNVINQKRQMWSGILSFISYQKRLVKVGRQFRAKRTALPSPPSISFRVHSCPFVVQKVTDRLPFSVEKQGICVKRLVFFRKGCILLSQQKFRKDSGHETDSFN